MNESQIRTLGQVRAFLDGTLAVEFKPPAEDAARYRHIYGVLWRFGYHGLRRAERGWVLQYLRATCGFSRAHLTRLVAQVLQGEPLAKHYVAPAQAFARRFTDADILLLARIDRQFGTLSGPGTAHLLRRAFSVYGDTRYERLATISVSHLYNLRHSFRYSTERIVHTKTRPVALAIGVRKAPAPGGRHGFIRIDSVHQGDLDGVKGVYHVNAVDCLTQWQVVGSCPRITEEFMLPLLQAMFAQFPFHILGFHADNGGEYINKHVAKMLNKLHIGLTKSRPRTSNDNALAETKNGAVVRKKFGYAHIAQEHAVRINAFNRLHMNPLLNLHRPCLFATEIADPHKPGRTRKVYRHSDVMTPLEKLATVSDVAAFLREGISLETLQEQAHAKTDLQAATDLNHAREKLFTSIRQAA